MNEIVISSNVFYSAPLRQIVATQTQCECGELLVVVVPRKTNKITMGIDMDTRRIAVIQAIVATACIAAYSVGLAAPLEDPVTPEGKLGRKAGEYLGGNELLNAFKKSRCGYLAKQSTKPTDAILQNEVLPEFPPEFRSELAKLMRGAMPEAKKTYVQLTEDTITRISKQYPDQPKTGCAVSYGMITTMASRFQGDWITERDIYRKQSKSSDKKNSSGDQIDSNGKARSSADTTNQLWADVEGKLSKTDPDWNTVVSSDNYQNWWATVGQYSPAGQKISAEINAGRLTDAAAISAHLRQFKADEATLWNEYKILVGDWKCGFGKSAYVVIWRLREDGKAHWASGNDKPIAQGPRDWGVGFGHKLVWGDLVVGNSTTSRSPNLFANLSSWSFDLLNGDSFAIGSCRKCLPFQC